MIAVEKIPLFTEEVYSFIMPDHDHWEKQIKNIVNSRYSDLKDFQPTLRFMNSAHTETEKIKKNRKERILQTDKYRKENFGEVFPLLNKVLQIYE